MNNEALKYILPARRPNAGDHLSRACLALHRGPAAPPLSIVCANYSIVPRNIFQ
jgi:hypothetical protein